MPDANPPGCPAQAKPISWTDVQATGAHTQLRHGEQRQGLGHLCGTAIQNSTASKQGLPCKLFPKATVFLRAVDELGRIFFNLIPPNPVKMG